MKLNFKYLIMTLAMLAFTTVTFALGQDVPEVDLTSPTVILGILTPVLTLGAVWAAKKIIPSLQGIGTLIAVPVIAGLITLISNAFVDNDLSWILQLVLGMGSVFLNQFYRELNGNS